MNAQSNNPFDFSNLFYNYDPEAIFKQLQNGFSAYQIPNLDTSALMESQRKNVEALIAANQAVLSGARELLSQQSTILRQAISDAAEAATSLAGATDPKALAEKQTELVQAAFQKALDNSKELSELVKKNQEEVSTTINKRVSEGLQEIKDAIGKLN